MTTDIRKTVGESTARHLAPMLAVSLQRSYDLIHEKVASLVFWLIRKASCLNFSIKILRKASQFSARQESIHGHCQTTVEF